MLSQKITPPGPKTLHFKKVFGKGYSARLSLGDCGWAAVVWHEERRRRAAQSGGRPRLCFGSATLDPCKAYVIYTLTSLVHRQWMQAGSR